MKTSPEAHDQVQEAWRAFLRRILTTLARTQFDGGEPIWNGPLEEGDAVVNAQVALDRAREAIAAGNAQDKSFWMTLAAIELLHDGASDVETRLTATGENMRAVLWCAVGGAVSALMRENSMQEFNVTMSNQKARIVAIPLPPPPGQPGPTQN